jgi:hypothetical protein
MRKQHKRGTFAPHHYALMLPALTEDEYAALRQRNAAPCGTAPLTSGSGSAGLGVRPREVVDALKGRQASERAVSTEAIVGRERGR